jgi:hypothetical protein
VELAQEKLQPNGWSLKFGKSSRGLYLAGVVGAGPPHEFPRTTELSILVTSVGVFILSPPPQPTQSMQTANNVKASLIVSP